VRAKKRLGQHFLHDPAVIRRIVAAIAPRPDDALVEIGPGPGALTAPLVAAVDRLHVVEVDRELAAELPSRVAHPERLVVHVADALRFDFAVAICSPPRVV
jgi:16S rRNA (adenine1518-N6/adenine1519-N6)-dimethyltransferase